MTTASPGTHDRIDAQTLAVALDVSLARLCNGLGLDEAVVASRPAAAAFQPSLQPVARTLEILAELFRDSGSVRAWLRTPHPDLDGRTALETILSNQAQAVCTILENALAGVPV